MRLLHIDTWQLHEVHSDVPPYIVASHRWMDQELTYQELTGPDLPSSVKEKAGYTKVQNFCTTIRNLVALCPHLKVEYLWIDTCCIDKANSTELTEALNSMFKWYSNAEACLAYLHDVVSLDEHPLKVLQSFKDSVWHTRGWCLQELLAPKLVLFFNKDWETVGRKRTHLEPPWITARAAGTMSLNRILEERTKVPVSVIWNFTANIEKYSIEERHSWMEDRHTTRAEDKVYALLGLFGVFMPLIYGEGEFALVRLRDVIAQKRRLLQSSDHKATGGNSPQDRGVAIGSSANGLRKVTVHFDRGDGHAAHLRTNLSLEETAKEFLARALESLVRNYPKFENGSWELRTGWWGQGRTMRVEETIGNIVGNDLYIIEVRPGMSLDPWWAVVPGPSRPLGDPDSSHRPATRTFFIDFEKTRWWKSQESNRATITVPSYSKVGALLDRVNEEWNYMHSDSRFRWDLYITGSHKARGRLLATSELVDELPMNEPLKAILRTN